MDYALMDLRADRLRQNLLRYFHDLAIKDDIRRNELEEAVGRVTRDPNARCRGERA